VLEQLVADKHQCARAGGEQNVVGPTLASQPRFGVAVSGTVAGLVVILDRGGRGAQNGHDGRDG
jgi:hypothetical protein